MVTRDTVSYTRSVLVGTGYNPGGGRGSFVRVCRCECSSYGRQSRRRLVDGLDSCAALSGLVTIIRESIFFLEGLVIYSWCFVLKSRKNERSLYLILSRPAQARNLCYPFHDLFLTWPCPV